MLRNLADKLVGNLSGRSLRQKCWLRNGRPLPSPANGSLHIPGAACFKYFPRFGQRRAKREESVVANLGLQNSLAGSEQ